MRIRKQVYDLTPDDLLLSPIWEFAHDEEADAGQDEATVRPVMESLSLDAQETMCIAAARFYLADGTEMDGFVSPGIQGDTYVGHLQPTIVTNAGQVAFWFGIAQPMPEQIEDAYNVLGKGPERIFPMSFSLAFPTSHPLTGTVPGFLYLDSKDFRTVQAVR